MYQYDLDQSEGRWMVEKWKYMAAELYKQTSLARGTNKSIFVNQETASGLQMCAHGFEYHGPEEEGGVWTYFFCGWPVKIDATIPTYAWDIKTDA